MGYSITQSILSLDLHLLLGSGLSSLGLLQWEDLTGDHLKNQTLVALARFVGEVFQVPHAVLGQLSGSLLERGSS